MSAADPVRPAPPAGAVQAVLFDFGGVYTASPFDAVRTRGTDLGIDPDQAMLFVFGSYERDTDHPWHRAERGELSLDDARALIHDQALAQGLDIDLFDMLASMAGSGLRDEMVERTRRLRADGYRTAMITNNVVEFRDYWRSLLPLDELFDLVVDSSEIGIRKPDPRIFALTLDQLGVAPEASIFLDDYPGNVVAARQAGLQAILVTADYHQALAELDASLAGSLDG
jgi:putative hydrolase of the HAD superfamily